MKLNVTASYYTSVDSEIDLPIDDISQVEEWYVKWGIFHYLLKGETEYREIDMENDAIDVIDWKRPSDAAVYGLAKDGTVDYSEPLLENW